MSTMSDLSMGRVWCLARSRMGSDILINLSKLLLLQHVDDLLPDQATHDLLLLWVDLAIVIFI
jgi:hypothetical protein